MKALELLGMLSAGVVGFVLAKRGGVRDVHPLAERPNASFFDTKPGSEGFCDGKIKERKMKGHSFRWVRNDKGCSVPTGSTFEIRIKPNQGDSPLIPPIPSHRDDIHAEVNWDVVRASGRSRWEYSLFQVLPDGREKELDDPELEI